MIGQFLARQGMPEGRVLLEDRARSTRENALLTLPLAQPAAGRALAAGHLGHAHAALDRRVPPRRAGRSCSPGRSTIAPPASWTCSASRAWARGWPSSIEAAYEWYGLALLSPAGLYGRHLPGPRRSDAGCGDSMRASCAMSTRAAILLAGAVLAALALREPPAKELFGARHDPRRRGRARHRQLRQGLSRRRRGPADRRAGLAGDAAVAQPDLGPPGADRLHRAAGDRSAAPTAGRACWSATWRSRGAGRCAPATPRTRSGSTSTCG